MRHTCSHVLAEAVKNLFPEAKLTIDRPLIPGIIMILTQLLFQEKIWIRLKRDEKDYQKRSKAGAVHTSEEKRSGSWKKKENLIK